VRWTVLARTDERRGRAVRDVGTEAGEEMAEMILRMLGVPADEAHAIATAPLPELP
jgi:hypothetical protein